MEIENPMFDVSSDNFAASPPSRLTLKGIADPAPEVADLQFTPDVVGKRTDDDNNSNIRASILKCGGRPLIGIIGLVVIGALAFIVTFAVFVPNWKSKLAEDDAAVKDLRKRLDLSQETVVSLNSSVHQLEEEVLEKSERIFQLEETQVELNSEVEAAEKQLQLDQNVIQDKNDQLRKLTNQLAGTNATISSLQSENKKLQDQIKLVTDMEKDLMEENEAFQRKNALLMEQVDNLTSTVESVKKEVGEKTERIFQLEEKQVELNELLDSAEKTVVDLKQKNSEQETKIDQLTFDYKNLHRINVELLIVIHKMKNPHLELYCSVDVELCYFGVFNNNATYDQAAKYCEFEQESQLLAEPRSKNAVDFLLGLTQQHNLKNVLLGATRGGDSSFRWLSDDSEIMNSHWGHDAPFPPGKGADKVVMTQFEDEWAWFSAYNDQTNFNFFCQQSID